METDAWIIDRVQWYANQVGMSGEELLENLEELDFCNYLETLVDFLCDLAATGSSTKVLCKLSVADFSGSKFDQMAKAWKDSGIHYYVKDLPRWLRAFWPAIPETFPNDRRGFRVGHRLDDPKSECIRKLLGPDFIPSLHHVDCGSFIYFRHPEARLGDRPDMADDFLWLLDIHNFATTPSRLLKKRPSRGQSSEVSSVLDAIIYQTLNAQEWRSPSQRRSAEASLEAVANEFLRQTEGFDFFSNIMEIQSVEDLGSNYSGDNGFGSILGGKCLLLVGISPEEIVYVGQFWDPWIET